jgi:hypothetical protein
VPLLILGAFLLGVPNPPMDAARLDIMHPRLWGRAEGVRTVLLAAGLVIFPALRTYPRDVATVNASMRAMTRGRAGQPHPRGGWPAAARAGRRYRLPDRPTRPRPPLPGAQGTG